MPKPKGPKGLGASHAVLPAPRPVQSGDSDPDDDDNDDEEDSKWAISFPSPKEYYRLHAQGRVKTFGCYCCDRTTIKIVLDSGVTRTFTHDPSDNTMVAHDADDEDEEEEEEEEEVEVVKRRQVGGGGGRPSPPHHLTAAGHADVSSGGGGSGSRDKGEVRSKHEGRDGRENEGDESELMRKAEQETSKAKTESDTQRQWLQREASVRLLRAGDTWLELAAEVEGAQGVRPIWPRGVSWELQLQRVGGAAAWQTHSPPAKKKHQAASVLLEKLQPGTDYHARARLGLSGKYTWSGVAEWQAEWGPVSTHMTTGGGARGSTTGASMVESSFADEGQAMRDSVAVRGAVAMEAEAMAAKGGTQQLLGAAGAGMGLEGSKQAGDDATESKEAGEEGLAGGLERLGASDDGAVAAGAEESDSEGLAALAGSDAAVNGHFFCEDCNVSVTSFHAWEKHVLGARHHRAKLAKQKTEEAERQRRRADEETQSRQAEQQQQQRQRQQQGQQQQREGGEVGRAREGASGVREHVRHDLEQQQRAGGYACELCGVRCNGPATFASHLASHRHRHALRSAGLPVPPAHATDPDSQQGALAAAPPVPAPGRGAWAAGCHLDAPGGIGARGGDTEHRQGQDLALGAAAAAAAAAQGLVLCTHFLKGTCRYGEQCRKYHHTEPGSRNCAPAEGGNGFGHRQEQQQQQQARYHAPSLAPLPQQQLPQPPRGKPQQEADEATLWAQLQARKAQALRNHGVPAASSAPPPHLASAPSLAPTSSAQQQQQRSQQAGPSAPPPFPRPFPSVPAATPQPPSATARSSTAAGVSSTAPSPHFRSGVHTYEQLLGAAHLATPAPAPAPQPPAPWSQPQTSSLLPLVPSVPVLRRGVHTYSELLDSSGLGGGAPEAAEAGHVAGAGAPAHPGGQSILTAGRAQDLSGGWLSSPAPAPAMGRLPFPYAPPHAAHTPVASAAVIAVPQTQARPPPPPPAPDTQPLVATAHLSLKRH